MKTYKLPFPDLKQQNSDLLKALKGFIDSFITLNGEDSWPANPNHNINKAREAIKNAEN